MSQHKVNYNGATLLLAILDGTIKAEDAMKKMPIKEEKGECSIRNGACIVHGNNAGECD